jgi:hypothetical protein
MHTKIIIGTSNNNLSASFLLLGYFCEDNRVYLIMLLRFKCSFFKTKGRHDLSYLGCGDRLI